MTRPMYEMDEAGTVTATTMTQPGLCMTQPGLCKDSMTVSDDVLNYKYLIGTVHRDTDDLELYRVVDVLEEVFDEDEGPLIVSYKRPLKPNGQLEPKTEDDEYSAYILIRLLGRCPKRWLHNSLILVLQ